MGNDDPAASAGQMKPHWLRWAVTCMGLAAANGLAVWAFVFVREIHPELRETLLHRIAVAALLVLGWPAFIAFIQAAMCKVVDLAGPAQELRVLLFLVVAQWIAIWAFGQSVPALWRKQVRRVLLVLWLICGVFLSMLAWGR